MSTGTARPGAAGGRYAAELGEAARLIAQRVRGASLPHDLVFQSRSGPPSVPWLEPDVNDHLAALAKGALTSGAAVPVPSAVVVVPVGFVSDHMEVVHDLDVEAAETAASLGLPFARAKAPGPTPRFAAMVSELVAERLSSGEPQALGGFGPRAYTDSDSAARAGGCPDDCCRYTPREAGVSAAASISDETAASAAAALAVSVAREAGACSPTARARSRSRRRSPAPPTSSPRWTAARRS